MSRHELLEERWNVEAVGARFLGDQFRDLTRDIA
jgi:hypothetical protein